MSIADKVGLRFVALIVVIFALSFLAGCVRRNTAPPPPPAPARDPLLADDTPVEESFGIQSTPSGALAKLSSGESCRTPCKVKKNNTDSFDVTISKDGYKGQKVSVSSVAKAIPGSGATGLPKLDRPHLVPNPLNVILEPNFTKR